MPRPAVLVASSVAGRLVTIDTLTGRTLRVLATTTAGSGCGFGSVSLSADRTIVYFERGFPIGSGAGACRQEIHAVPVAGGREVNVADGTRPRISPDGTKLAYFTAGPRDTSTPEPRLVVRDLATGAETVVADRIEGCDCGLRSTWAPDNRHLAVQAIDCGCGGQAYGPINVYDTSNPTAPPQPVPVPAALQGRATYAEPTYRPDGTMFVFEVGDYDFEAAKSKSTTRMLVIEPTSGAVVSQITTGFDDRWYSGTDADRSGTHLLYLSRDVLMASDDGSRPAPLAQGVIEADW